MADVYLTIGLCLIALVVVAIVGIIINQIIRQSKNISMDPFAERRAQLKWGGLSIDYQSPLDYTKPGEGGYLPLTNSMKAIERIQAAYNTPPWSDDRAADIDAKGGNAANIDRSTDATAIHMRKKSKAQDIFRVDKTRSPTSTRGMSV
jgi:hypothetical protein